MCQDDSVIKTVIRPFSLLIHISIISYLRLRRSLYAVLPSFYLQNSFPSTGFDML